jgi:hypothetical protein
VLVGIILLSLTDRKGLELSNDSKAISDKTNPAAIWVNNSIIIVGEPLPFIND